DRPGLGCTASVGVPADPPQAAGLEAAGAGSGGPPATVVEAPAAGDGEAADGGDAAGDEAGGGADGVGATTGLLGPGAEEARAVGLELGRGEPLDAGRVAAEGPADGAALPEAVGAALNPGLPDAAPCAEAGAPVSAGSPDPGRPGRGAPESSGADVLSTLPAAGLSSALPGTGSGSQGAPALPDSRAATMTTA
ncbi:hypothetical protein ACFVYK_21415, partial [Streptomyces sp. NPDC058291]